MPHSAHRPLLPAFLANTAADTEPGCLCVCAGIGLQRHITAATLHRLATRAAEDTEFGEATADAQVLQAGLSPRSPCSRLDHLHRTVIKQLRCQTSANSEELYLNQYLNVVFSCCREWVSLKEVGHIAPGVSFRGASASGAGSCDRCRESVPPGFCCRRPEPRRCGCALFRPRRESGRGRVRR